VLVIQMEVRKKVVAMTTSCVFQQELNWDPPPCCVAIRLRHTLSYPFRFLQQQLHTQLRTRSLLSEGRCSNLGHETNSIAIQFSTLLSGKWLLHYLIILFQLHNLRSV
jgi:hypothetical protein